MAEKLKQALEAKGMSQVAFARACGASKQAVQSWVKTGRIDKKHLPKFVEVLGYPLEWWLDDGGDNSPTTPASTVFEPITAPLQQANAAINDLGGRYTVRAWPFASVSQLEYACLSDRQKGMVEGYVSALLNNNGGENKRNGTSDR